MKRPTLTTQGAGTGPKGMLALYIDSVFIAMCGMIHLVLAKGCRAWHTLGAGAVF